jgi:replicative DNA helicase
MPKMRKDKEPKAVMTFEVSTLNTLIRYAMCTNISKSSIVNLGKLVNSLEMAAYNYSPDIVSRLKLLKYVTEARTTYGMKEPEVIKTFITNSFTDGADVLNDCEPLIADTLNFTECTAIAEIVNQRLEYLYIYKYKDQIIDCLNRFNKGGWTSYHETVEEVKKALQELLTNINTVGRSDVGVLRRLNMAADNYNDLVDTIVRKAKMPNAVLQTGIRQLNAVLCPGFQAGRLYLILGLTGRFKSGTLLNITDQMCKYNPQLRPIEDGRRKTVLFISNENTIEETYTRLLDMYSGVNDDIVRMSTEEAINTLRDRGGYRFNDEMGITIEFRYYRNMEMSTADIYTIINELSDEGYKVIAVVLDYIARVASVSNAQEERFRLANVAKELKGIATYYSIPVITAQQVNREGNGIIDAAMRDDKADLAKFLGSTAVAESYGLIFEADWVALVNLEKRKSDEKWFLTFNRLKIRGKQDPSAVTYFNHPFADEKRIRLETDVDKPMPLSVVSLASDLENVSQEENRLMVAPRMGGQNRTTSGQMSQCKSTKDILSSLHLDGVKVAG